MSDPSSVARPPATTVPPSLPMLVLTARQRLGPNATPEDVTRAVREAGIPNATTDEVRTLWDEGHLPGG